MQASGWVDPSGPLRTLYVTYQLPLYSGEMQYLSRCHTHLHFEVRSGRGCIMRENHRFGVPSLLYLRRAQSHWVLVWHTNSCPWNGKVRAILIYRPYGVRSHYSVDTGGFCYYLPRCPTNFEGTVHFEVLKTRLNISIIWLSERVLKTTETLLCRNERAGAEL